jgi:hypothetical protein
VKFLNKIFLRLTINAATQASKFLFSQVFFFLFLAIHEPLVSLQFAGQNLYSFSTTGTIPSVERIIEDAISSWYSEYEDADMRDINSFGSRVNSRFSTFELHDRKIFIKIYLQPHRSLHSIGYG